MKTWHLSDDDSEWEILGQTQRTQAAIMTIRNGESEGGPNNKHADSDQWLFVLGGSGSATVGGKKVVLRKGVLLLVEAGETHQITANARSVLRTLNFYGPPTEFEE